MAKRRSRQRGGLSGGRSRFDETKHSRDRAGRFADKPGVGNDAPRSLKTAGVTADDEIRVLRAGAIANDRQTVGDAIAGSADRGEALRSLAAQQRAGLIGFSERPFSPDDLAAIADYTGAGHKAMNWQLRGVRSATPEVTARINALDEALRGRTLGASATLYRGIGGVGAKALIGSGLKKGAIIEDPGFMSTTRNAAVARRFAQQSSENIVLEIRAYASTKAVDIAKVSSVGSGEQEVLFARGSRLKVLSWDKKSRTLLVEALHG